MPPAVPSQPLAELTVTCRQCGAADMVRLDRKEYKCRHCGSITIISDSDAERLEQVLKQFLAKQTVRPQAQPAVAARVVAGTIVAAVGAAVIAGVLLTRSQPGGANTNTAAAYFDEQGVRNNQLVMSSLHWQPDSTSHGGSYTGLRYNHSGFAVMPPSYTINLFHNGLKYH